MPTISIFKRPGRAISAALALSLLLAGCDNPFTRGKSESSNSQIAQGDYERGPHRGRMLRSGNFAAEITIFEEGVEPEFHVYVYQDNKPLDPKTVALNIRLTRLGGYIDEFSFKPKDDFLRGDGVVHEPHSFDVAVKASHKGSQHSWTYDFMKDARRSQPKRLKRRASRPKRRDRRLSKRSSIFPAGSCFPRKAGRK